MSKCTGIKKNQKYKNTLVAKERKNISSSIIIGNIRLKYSPLYTFDVNLKSPSFLGKYFKKRGTDFAFNHALIAGVLEKRDRHLFKSKK